MTTNLSSLQVVKNKDVDINDQAYFGSNLGDTIQAFLVPVIVDGDNVTYNVQLLTLDSGSHAYTFSIITVEVTDADIFDSALEDSSLQQGHDFYIRRTEGGKLLVDYLVIRN